MGLNHLSEFKMEAVMGQDAEPPGAFVRKKEADWSIFTKNTPFFAKSGWRRRPKYS
jgi:hypothetical protein